MNQQFLAVFARRLVIIDADHLVDVISLDRFGALRIENRVDNRHGAHTGDRAGASRVDDAATHAGGLERVLVEFQQAVPHHFVAGFRERERRSAEAAIQAQLIVLGFAGTGVFQRVVLEILRVVGATVGGVDIQAIVGILLQHRLDAFGQCIVVLGHVLGRDGK
ncbi:hypothetical protein D9M71_376350 [compost metagenome]